ncbi:MAG: hypothetical protein HW392_1489 [Steroidobacteraceae bacterium]|nr:hypothetical protein [Steroidobacteraceae bacterium]
MQMIRRSIAVLLLAILQSPPAAAELTVQILRGMAETVPIAIVPFGWEGGSAAAWDVAATVQADLERSGRFQPTGACSRWITWLSGSWHGCRKADSSCVTS